MMELYHYGFVVDDIESAMATYGEPLHLTWAPVSTRRVRVVVDGAGPPVDVRLLATYSQQGPPYVELIQELDGDIWSQGSLGLNHVGFWVPDLAAGFERLRAAGLDASVQAVDEDGEPTRFSYQHAPGGSGAPWVELVDVAIKPQLTDWICGNAYVVT